jgi:hypothetical protein
VTDPTRYRRRAKVEAVQWTGSNEAAMAALCSPFDFQTIDPEDRVEDPDQTAAVRTHSHGGWIGLKPGDWVLREAGRYSTASDAEFRADWEPVPAVPSAAAPPTQADEERRERYATAISKWHRDWEQPLYTQGADAVIAVADAEQAELRRERDLAIAHDRQPYPTAWAYEQACKALRTHRERADAAEAVLARIGQMADVWERRLPEVIRTPAVVSAIRAALEPAGSRLVEALQPETQAADRDALIAELLPVWEAVYEPGNVSDYLIGYANDRDAATGAAEAWMRSQAEVTGRLEWTPWGDAPMPDGYDAWFELVERHVDGIDTGPGIIVRRRIEPAVGEQPDTQARDVVVGCGLRTLRRDHAPHDWEPQPGLTVHCPGHAPPLTEPAP